MEKQEILKIVNLQREYSRKEVEGVEKRKEWLVSLREAIISMESEIISALHKDLKKSEQEAFMAEIGQVYGEIDYMLKNLHKFAKDRKVKTGLANFPAKCYVKSCPYGVALIISPWNYPFLLALAPLIDALAAGNSVVLKPSELSPNTSFVLERLITSVFPTEKVAVIQGGKEESGYLLDSDVDCIFYTGGGRVGKIVARKAAEKLIPVTLELGGKSPCIVAPSANIALAARRIVFGKCLNAGQTCVAPDYIYCHSSVRDKLIEALKSEIVKQYGENPLNTPYYPAIINATHFERLRSYLKDAEIIFGGEYAEKDRRIAPTLVSAKRGDALMNEEIFGPILPILCYDNFDSVIAEINGGETPLALYLFAEDKGEKERVTTYCRYGGGCINDTIMHLASSELPFGGLGASGLGAYHGKRGFMAFSHEKSIVDKSSKIDMPMRYQPISKKDFKIIRRSAGRK